jgi:hypothetical protein
MTDENLSDHYFVMVGEVCEAARLARLAVRIKTRDGRSVLGIPEPMPALAQEYELDDTGFQNRILVDGIPLQLSEVVEVRLLAPS